MKTACLFRFALLCFVLAISPLMAQRDQYVLLRLYAPQLADGGGWQTTLTIVNPLDRATTGTLRFFDSFGAPLAIGPLGLDARQTSIAVIIPARGTYTYETPNLPGPTRVGYATYLSEIGGSAGTFDLLSTFRSYAPGRPDFEATAVGMISTGRRYSAPFDQRNGLATGVALVNPDNIPASFQFTFFDETGNQLGTRMVSLSGLNHTSFVLTDRFPELANRRGQFEVERLFSGVAPTPSSFYPSLTLLVLRFSSGGSFSAMPLKYIAR